MEMVAVDPKLFITCRLCLDEMGQYQIVPSVQQQIKYCFDIDVQPFDGLPQLICVKCKDILSNYSSTKKLFHEKQENLKNNLIIKNDIEAQPQQDAVSSTQCNQDNAKISKPITKRKILDPSSSSDSDAETLFSKNKTKSKQKVLKQSITWESDYKKHFMCRLCNVHCNNIRTFMTHYRSHDSLRNKYSGMLNRNCIVYMDKLDDKPNITGLSELVVHDSDRIIQNKGFYYILYSNSIVQADDNAANSDSTEELDIGLKQKKKRRRRVLSDSSTKSDNGAFDAIESEKGDGQTANNLCIDIEDTSDSEADHKTMEESNDRFVANKSLTEYSNDHKTIQGIINTCVYNYQKKKKYLEVDKAESKLKHIILSIGTKVINDKQNMNCIGLLRYIEWKDLDVQWVPKTFSKKSYLNNDSIRIFTKLKAPINYNDSGWVNLKSSESIERPKLTMPGPSSVLQEIPVEMEIPAESLLLCEHTANGSDAKNKLLNANPVANPKQLPKKIAQKNKSRTKKRKNQQNNCCISCNDAESNISDTMIEQDNSPFNNSSQDSHMPIITSTTSLADIPALEKSRNVISISPPADASQSVPRIKVKPPSELMSERGLTNLLQEQASSITTQVSVEGPVVPMQNAIDILVPPLMVIDPMNSPRIQVMQVPFVNVSQVNYQLVTGALTGTNTVAVEEKKQDSVILDTVELPNTKTDSPFKYLKSLMLVHNLVLLDPNAPKDLNPLLTNKSSFHCLIKFKVVFKQEKKAQPVVLCLSLYTLRNLFSLNLGKDVNVYKISANWQWEILQVFTGEVVVKILQHAKKCGQETFNNTNKFLCLLKSIKMKKT